MALRYGRAETESYLKDLTEENVKISTEGEWRDNRHGGLIVDGIYGGN